MCESPLQNETLCGTLKRSRYCDDVLATTAMVAFVAVAVVAAIPTTIIPALVTAVLPAAMLTFLETRNVLAAVPLVPHKEDPLAAGVVFAAVLAPMFGMAGRYAQIDRRTIHRYPLDYHRLTIDHLRLRIVANVESAIKAGLADADGNTDIGRECRRGGGGECYCE